jgi:coenzyme PQQ synthesis protein D (PqqD)
MPTDDAAKTTYVQTQGCEISHMPDGFVVYQVEQEKVHYLNPTAAMVYELCSTRLDATGMAKYLQSVFALPEPPLAEVTDCIDTLIKQGLIEAC